MTDDEYKLALYMHLVGRASYNHGLLKLVGKGRSLSALNVEMTSRLDEIKEPIDDADIKSLEVLGVDTTGVVVEGSRRKVAYAADVMKRRTVHVKLVRSESKRSMVSLLKPIFEKGAKVKLFIIDLSLSELGAIREVAKDTEYLVQGCLFHFLDNLDDWLPVGEDTLVKPPGGEKRRITPDEIKLRNEFKELALLPVFSVTNEARARNRQRLLQFDSKGDEGIDKARWAILDRMCDGVCTGYQPGKFYHTAEELAAYLKIPLYTASRLQFNNVSESHEKLTKTLQSNFGGSFRSERTAKGQIRARYHLWNEERDTEQSSKGKKDAESIEATISFPFRRIDDPIDLERLAGDLGADLQLLIEAAKGKGYFVLGRHGVPVDRWRRESLTEAVARILRYHTQGRMLPLTDLAIGLGADSGRHHHHLHVSWARYPEELQVLLLRELGFEVKPSPDNGTQIITLPAAGLKKKATRHLQEAHKRRRHVGPATQRYALPELRGQNAGLQELLTRVVLALRGDVPEEAVEQSGATPIALSPEQPLTALNSGTIPDSLSGLLESEPQIEVVLRILAGDDTTHAIAVSLRKSDPAVSQTLKKLKEQGLVKKSHQEGRFVHYKVNEEKLSPILTLIKKASADPDAPVKP